jgi:hypothetical protein
VIQWQIINAAKAGRKVSRQAGAGRQAGRQVSRQEGRKERRKETILNLCEGKEWGKVNRKRTLKGRFDGHTSRPKKVKCRKD